MMEAAFLMKTEKQRLVEEKDDIDSEGTFFYHPLGRYEVLSLFLFDEAS